MLPTATLPATGQWVMAHDMTPGRVVYATDDYVHVATATDRFRTSAWYAPVDVKPMTGNQYASVTPDQYRIIDQRFAQLTDTRCENCGQSIPVGKANWDPSCGYAAGIGFCVTCDAILPPVDVDA